VDPTRPEFHPRRILLAVTGLSPQIVTETLYALAVQAAPAWVPSEVHVVTTARGAENARLKLLSDEPGWFHRLCRDYRLPDIAFSESHVHVIPRPDETPLDDIRDDADNQLAADFIAETVRELTADDRAEIHASIAGGRKTMGFYLGYAMSLYGRAWDRLSHVLVSAPFESHPEFFYPTPQTRVITSLDRTQDALDTSAARVWLGDIPFVRLRGELPRELLEGRARFSEAVAEAQRALPPVALTLHPASLTVTAAGTTFRLKPAEFAFYWMLAERCRNAAAGLHWSEDGVAKEFLGFYGRLVNANSGDFERAETAYRRGMTKENLDPMKAHINKSLKTTLGPRRAGDYRIVLLEKIAGTRYRRSGLTLPPSAITIEAPSLR
jgi:CRISPR-associated protein (TIGR02584 family)